MGGRLARAFTPATSARDVVDGVRNVVLFAGWGLAWYITAGAGAGRVGAVAARTGGTRGAGGAGSRPRAGLAWRRVAWATATGMLLSGIVETVQLFSPVRTASMLDVMTNTGGAFAGGDHGAAARPGGRRPGRAVLVRNSDALFAGGDGLAAALEAVLPGLRQAMLKDATGSPLARFNVAVGAVDWSLGPPRLVLLQLLLFIPAGALLTAALVEHGARYRRAFTIAGAGGAGAALLFELLRGASGQPMHLGAGLAHAAGALLGTA